jgi:hypothetical protein
MADLLVEKGLAGHVVEHGGEERGKLVTRLLQARVKILLVMVRFGRKGNGVESRFGGRCRFCGASSFRLN